MSEEPMTDERLRDVRDALERRGMDDFPPVLDVCCGPRGMWIDKGDRRALFTDCRSEVWETEYPCGTYEYRIEPDLIADFSDLPFPSETFSLVVMDPPHIPQETDRGQIVRQYGRLTGDWKGMLRDGVNEAMRVLKPNGVLIFKWNEVRVPLREIRAALDHAPLFGHKAGKKMQTHWLVFMKEDRSDD
jgi:SAM-dependent methyltransferase